MLKSTLATLAAILCCIASPGQAALPDEAQAAAERLLGSGSEQAQWQSHLPFTRKLHAWGVVVDSLSASTEAAGVPPAAMVEALHALATAIDPERDVKAGDLFWVHYEQEYTVEGDPIGIGRVLWVELRTAAKGIVAIHRFRASKSSAEPFWLATGQSTEPPSLRLPLERISISSGFGLRADPFDQPTSQVAMGPMLARSAAGPKAKAANTLGKGNSPIDAEARAMMARAGAVPPGVASRLAARRFERVIITGESGLTNPAFANGLTGARKGSGPAPPGLSIDLVPLSPRSAAAPSQDIAARAVAPGASLVMHQGIDMLAEPGTPVFAAADGVVTGAAPNGGYGNWIEIQHEGEFQTQYGHLSAFAPGIAPGVRVEQGDIIGFTGSTGRTTGPHLHFELLVNGRPTNPIANPATKHGMLKGPEMMQFKKVVARDLAEREREAKSM